MHVVDAPVEIATRVKRFLRALSSKKRWILGDDGRISSIYATGHEAQISLYGFEALCIDETNWYLRLYSNNQS